VSILQKAIGFILLPLYTAYLSVFDYGIISMVLALISFLSVFYLLSLNGALARYYFEYKDDPVKINQYLSSIIIFVLIISLVFTVLLIILKDYLLTPFVKGIDFYPYLIIALLVVFLNPTYLFFQTLLQVKQEAKKYARSQLFFFLINLILTIVLVVNFKMKALGIILALGITNLIFFIYSLIYFLPILHYGLKKLFLKESLLYALPLLPHSLSAWSITMIDRFFINNYMDTPSVGIYNIGYQLGCLVSVMTLAINQAFVPWFFEKMKSKEDKRIEIIKFAEFINIIVCTVALLISLFSKEILILMVSENYRPAWKIVPFICFGFVLNNLYFFFVNPLFFNKRGTKFIPIITVISAVLGIVFNILLVPTLGSIGSAIANMISWLCTSIIALMISNRIEKINYKASKMFSIVIIFFILSLFAFVTPSITSTLLFLIKFLIFLIVASTIWMFKRKEYYPSLLMLYSKIKMKGR
jgi:O-antigen/teichoic acid export membrane protein